MAKEAKPAVRESFEDLYAKLEAHTDKLEHGGLTLDESIALYEDGMRIARECQARLEEAEQKITKLKESFAPVPRNSNGANALEDAAGAPADYEYVEDESEPIEPPDD